MSTRKAIFLVLVLVLGGALGGSVLTLGLLPRVLNFHEARIDAKIRELYLLQHRKANSQKGPKWTKEEWEELRPLARLFGVPLGYAKMLRMIENGGWIYTYGQIEEDWSIKELWEVFPVEQWQMVQAQRTVNRGLIHFLWARAQGMEEGRRKLGRTPDPESIIRWLELERDAEFSRFMATEAWNMRSGRGTFIVFAKEKFPELEGIKTGGKDR